METVMQITFPTWKTVKVGSLLRADKMTINLLRMGIEVNEASEKFMKMMGSSFNGRTLNLTRVSVEDLGFDEYADTETIFDRARFHGLRLCPPETGPQLWLQHPELLGRSETILVGMTLVEGRIWSLGRDVSQRWLLAPYCRGWKWSPGHQWVFVQPD